MSLVYIYSDSTGSTIDITDRCRVPSAPRGGLLMVKEQAEEGAVAISDLIVDDPLGDIEFTGHRRLYIYEDTAPAGDQIVFNGFTFGEKQIRGPYKVGPGRQWVLSLNDPNVFMTRRIMNGADADRPEETDIARMQALLTMTELNTVDDDLYLNTSATATVMNAYDYRGESVGAYLDSCRQASGKNAYIWYREATGEYSIWYDFANSDAYDSGITLTNIESQHNETTHFLYSQERTSLNRDPSRVISGLYGTYTPKDGTDGVVYVQDTQTIDDFAAIDFPASMNDVDNETMALARANRYLQDGKTEHEIIHVVMTLVPRDKVNVVKKGQLIDVVSTYMTPQGESIASEAITCRILYKNLTEISEDPTNSFEIEMDLDPVYPPPSEQYGTSTEFSGCEHFVWPEGAPTDGNLLIGALAQRSDSEFDSDITPIGNTAESGCNDVLDVPGTEWTFINGLYVNTNFSSDRPGYPISMAWREADGDPTAIRWGGVGGLSGTSRARSHQAEIAITPGAPSVTATSQDVPVSSSVFTSPDITVGAAGYIFAICGYNCSGPADGGSAIFTLIERAPAHVLSEGFQYSNFGGYSWFGYRYVTGAGTYNIILDRTNAPRAGSDSGWIMGFWAAAAPTPGFPA